MRLRLILLTLASLAIRVNAQPASPSGGQETILRSETRVVLVDAVVDDKKGKFIRDLGQKDFRIWEDGKEQAVTSFSLESASATPDRSRHYIVLFFDNSTVSTSSQLTLRKDADQFVDAYASPDRYMAVVNYGVGGNLQIAQNFTAITEPVKKAVIAVQGSSGIASLSNQAGSNQAGSSIGARNGRTPGSQLGPPGMTEMNTATYRGLLASLRAVASSMATIRGRKALVLFSAGFPLTGELNSDLTATIDACNKANVGIYAVDSRGMTALLKTPEDLATLESPRKKSTFSFAGIFGGLQNTNLMTSSFQVKGGGTTGGGTTGGGTTGGGTAGGGTTGGTTGGGTTGGGTTGGGIGGGTTGGNTGIGNPTGAGSNTSPSTIGGRDNPQSLSRAIQPGMSDEPIGSNQSVLRSLADSTGGIIIINTNDLVAALGRVAQEQDQYYLIGYTPTVESAEGTCHNLRVKVQRSGTEIRARQGYCTAKPVDALAGKVAGKDLETRAASTTSGNITANMSLPWFYTGANQARVSVAMDIAPTGMKFQKEKGKLHGELNLVGIAYKEDASVAARFSDTVKFDFDNQQQADAFTQTPYHYSNQFAVASGKYTFRIAFSSGAAGFGKAEMPLAVDPWDSKSLGISGIAMSKQVQRVADLTADLDDSLLEDSHPLTANGMQLIPTGYSQFPKTDRCFFYVEVYDPKLADATPPTVGVQIRVLDRKTGELKGDSGMVSVANQIRPGHVTAPLAFALPLTDLVAGGYRLEVKTALSQGNESAVRTTDFDVN